MTNEIRRKEMKRFLIIKMLTVIFSALLILSCQPPASQEEAVEESFGAAPVKVYKVKRQRMVFRPNEVCLLLNSSITLKKRCFYVVIGVLLSSWVTTFFQ